MARCAVLLVVAMCCVPEAADACSCIRPHACSAMWSAAAVFAGRVVDIRPATDEALPGARIVRFQIEHRGLGVTRYGCHRPCLSTERRQLRVYIRGWPAIHRAGLWDEGRPCHSHVRRRACDGGARRTRVPERVRRSGTRWQVVRRRLSSEDSRLLTPGDGRARMIPVAGARVLVTGRVSRESTTGSDGSVQRFEIFRSARTGSAWFRHPVWRRQVTRCR